METTIDPMKSKIDSILAMVDCPEADAEIPLADRVRVEEAKKHGYFAARAQGLTTTQAEVAGQRAYDIEVALILKEREAADAASFEQVPVHLPPALPPPPPFVPVPNVPRPAPPTMPNIEAGEVDAVGAARSRTDADALIAAGFSPTDPVYERGSRVNSTGVRNARRERIEHDKKPLVVDATTDLIGRIQAEKRRTVIVPSGGIGMDDQGRIVATDCTVDGKPCEDVAVNVSKAAFGALTTRLGYKGAEYLARMPVSARAFNVNMWRSVISGSNPDLATEAKAISTSLGRPPVGEAEQCALRLRTKRDGSEEVFAVVSPTYTPYDADLIADSIRRACMNTQEVTTSVGGETFAADLSQARGRMTYDGAKSRFEVMFHSNIQPEVYVAGEFFKAGVLIRTDDTGGGGCRVVPVVWQNMCLNLIIVEACASDAISIWHLGNVQALAKKFEAAFKKSIGRLGHFMKAWGYACKDDVLALTRQGQSGVPANVEQALPGLFNGILNAKLVSIPGKREDVVEQLCRQWEADDSGAKVHGLTRASLVNAFTRYAHTIVMDDPWAEDEIQRDAGRLLFGRGSSTPAPIPYLSLEEVAESTAMLARAN
jgi:hypothetical protein